MCCIFYYNNFVSACNHKIHARKGLILYYKTNGTIQLSMDHAIVPKNLRRKLIVHCKILFKLNQWRKCLICVEVQFEIFLLQKIFSKKWCVTKIIFTKLRPFDYQKSFANVCRKFLVQLVNLTFMSLNGLSFKKLFWVKSCCLTWWGKKNKNMFCQN
jgi:hypothetical protein